jgi:hypothetical protein
VDAPDDKAVACYVLHFKADNQSLASPIFGGKFGPVQPNTGELIRKGGSITTPGDTRCISIGCTDRSCHPSLVDFQFSPNFSIKIGLEALGKCVVRPCLEEYLD